MDRVLYLSMFEISSEKGKAERMIDLLHDGGDICMQHSVIKGLREVSRYISWENFLFYTIFHFYLLVTFCFP